MASLPDAHLAHVGFHVRDLEAMIAFYQRALGLILTDIGDYYMGGKIAFLSRDPSEHHQVVLASGRTGDKAIKLINQISFRVASLEDLRTYYVWLTDIGADEINPRNHGNAWSVYFLDPEGNRIELYTPTPWYIEQPVGDPLDFSMSLDDIRASTKARVESDPTFMSREKWMSQINQRMRASSALR